jgi:hypothetical protein
MQLCTNARFFLDLIASSGEPKLWELTPPEARKKVLELTRMVECYVEGCAFWWHYLFPRRSLGIGRP